MFRYTRGRWMTPLAGAVLGTVLASAPATAEQQGKPSGTEPRAGAGTATAERPALLIGVEAARHPTYDRVVFEYANGTPDYEVSYGPVQRPGNGNRVELRGERTLTITTRHSAGTSDGPLADTPTNWTYKLPTVAQVNHLGSFEGVGKAGIGSTAASPTGFRVFTLPDPARLVIDIAHTGPSNTEPADTGPAEQPNGPAAPNRPTEPQQQAAEPSTSTPLAAPAQPAQQDTATASGATRHEPTVWQLGLIGGIALAALTGAALVIRKLTSATVR